MEENLEWRRKLELLCFSVALGDCVFYQTRNAGTESLIQHTL